MQGLTVIAREGGKARLEREKGEGVVQDAEEEGERGLP